VAILRLSYLSPHAPSYKWMTFEPRGTGKCKHTVELAGVCLNRNQLGNIAFMVLGELMPPVPFTSEGVAKRGYNVLPEYPGVSKHPHAKQFGKFIGSRRTENLAAFGVGEAVARGFRGNPNLTYAQFKQLLVKELNNPITLSKYAYLYAPDTALNKGDLTFIPFHGGVNTRSCNLTDNTYPIGSQSSSEFAKEIEAKWNREWENTNDFIKLRKYGNSMYSELRSSFGFYRKYFYEEF